MKTGGARTGWRRDLAVGLVLAFLSVAFLWDVLFTGKVLLPVDDLFGMPPWGDFAAQFGIKAPHNHLIADMIFQNYSWKSFAKDALQSGSLPLWNPHLLAGVPFLAAGQYAVIYPLGFLFYLLPVAIAYGWFTLLHVFLAGFFTYIYLRVIAVARPGALVGGITFAFSAFLVVSFVWPMILSTAVWLPLLLALIELSVRGIAVERGKPPTVSPWLWPLLGALVVALQFLAGHMEISFYVLFTAGFYAACRLSLAFWQTRRPLRVAAASLALLGMVGLGTGLAAVQIVPFSEAIAANFRAGFVSYDDVAGYALPKQRAVSFIVPDFFGNPAVHSFWDVTSGGFKSARHPGVDGQEIDFIADWDRKNYVEGASYAGILPLILAVLALLYRRNRYTVIFAAYATWSLLLAFGSPLYRLFFYGIPGFDQLHTPFRWLLPYTFSVAVLAGIGAGWLVESGPKPRSLARLASAAVVVGLLMVAVLVGSAMLSSELVPRLQELVQRSDRLRESVGDGMTFFAFEWRNLAVFALFFIVSGAILWLAARAWSGGTGRDGIGRRAVLGSIVTGLVVAATAADLFVYGFDFNTRADQALLDFVPPSVAYLQQDREVHRVVSVGEADVLTPNTAMRYGVQDARGYDTIIPRQYVDFWSLIEDPRGYLVYSKIHKLRDTKSLQSPLLRLLNVKYVLSAELLDVPDYELVYRGEVYIYRSKRYLPRAFVVDDPGGLRFATGRDELAVMLGRTDFDPEREIVLEDTSAPILSSAPRPGRTEPPAFAGAGSAPTVGSEKQQVAIVDYTANRVSLSVENGREGYMVLADSYFPGWAATVDGTATKVFRADGNFRAVYLPAGSHSIVFEYKPASFRAGLALTGVSFAMILLGLMYFLRPRGLLVGYGRLPAQRVAKNSVLPFGASLANKLVTAAFAMVVLRMLGPDGVGKYTLAIIVAGYFEILTNFGLGTLLTREVAKDPTAGNRYLGNTALLRLILWFVSLPVIGLFIAVWQAFFSLDGDTALAIVLLILALVPGHLSSAVSALFYANERMEYPAVVSIVTALATVALGTVALVAGWGFVGLAAVAVVVNLVTAVIFLGLTIRVFGRPKPEADGALLRRLIGLSAPLMLNHLLATVFFRVDVLLLQPLQGNRAVGYYGTAYRFVDALNIIPSAFTFAIFPQLARYARDAQTALNRSFSLAVKFLLIVSLPITVGTVFLAEPIILFFAGPDYLPHAAIALQVMIWFLPFSYVNSVTQYVLIAVNQQRYITTSFLVATSFNIVANLALIPRFGYVGAALVTILSEIVLLVPFLRAVWRHVGAVPLLALAARPCLASGVMALVLWRLSGSHPLLLILAGAFTYALTLVGVGGLDRQDRALVRQLLGRRSSDQYAATSV